MALSATQHRGPCQHGQGRALPGGQVSGRWVLGGLIPDPRLLFLPGTSFRLACPPLPNQCLSHPKPGLKGPSSEKPPVTRPWQAGAALPAGSPSLPHPSQAPSPTGFAWVSRA